MLNHILFSVENAPKDLVIRLTMLFHDIGKLSCYSESDEDVERIEFAKKVMNSVE